MRVVPDEISFIFDNKKYHALVGDSIASALYRNKVKVITRSMKFHRPRGLFCGTGDCPNCLANVNGIPNVRTCTTQIKNGMIVRSQNHILSRNFDIVAIMDHVYRKGFNYHHKFIRPEFMKSIYQKMIRRMAGIGKLPIAEQPAKQAEEIAPDVLIVGGEGSALTVARNCAYLGLKVLMIQQNSASISPIEESLYEKYGGPDQCNENQKMEQMLSAGKNFRWLADSVAIGAFDDGAIGAITNDQLHIIRSKSVIIAEGLRESPIRFGNWDLPGVLQETAARRLLNTEIPPGDEVLLIGDPVRCANLSIKLKSRGSSIVAILAEPDIGIEFDSSTWNLLRTGWKILEAKGRTSVNKAIITDGQRTEKISCDAIITFGRLLPKIDLARQLGCTIHIDEKKIPQINVNERFETLRHGIFAIGGCAGIEEPSKAWQSAEIAGKAITDRFLGMKE